MDHNQIKTTLNSTVKPTYSKTQVVRKRKLNTAQVKNADCQANLQAAINSAQSENNLEEEAPDSLWKSMSKAVLEVAAVVLGYARRKNAYRFSENAKRVRVLNEKRNTALRTQLRNPTATNQQALSTALPILQRQVRETENDWRLQKAKVMQQKEDANKSAGFFKSLKEVFISQTRMDNAFLSSDGTTVITETTQLVRRWMELLDSFLNAEAFPPQQELEEALKLKEMNMATNKTMINKLPRLDGIPPEVCKFGGEELTRRLHKLLGKPDIIKPLPRNSKMFSSSQSIKNATEKTVVTTEECHFWQSLVSLLPE